MYARYVIINGSVSFGIGELAQKFCPILYWQSIVLGTITTVLLILGIARLCDLFLVNEQ